MTVALEQGLSTDCIVDLDMLNETEWWRRALQAVKAHSEGNTALGAMRSASVSHDPDTRFPMVYDGMPPQAGYYKVRVAPRQDIWLPVRVYYVPRCEVGRYHASPQEEWFNCCKFPISREEWEDMKGLKSTLAKGGIHARV